MSNATRAYRTTDEAPDEPPSDEHSSSHMQSSALKFWTSLCATSSIPLLYSNPLLISPIQHQPRGFLAVTDSTRRTNASVTRRGAAADALAASPGAGGSCSPRLADYQSHIASIHPIHPTPSFHSHHSVSGVAFCHPHSESHVVACVSKERGPDTYLVLV
ncbi:hypothetical protein BDY17DRAFT_308867 [Neohortaea acidophila]|uniref:Uncharacterized protein n=1 Tax=Neohortaea acidophila TaxID=245834 RepID=A0A6A6PZQ6_9PEZI|nr:uncharacterized protein BDY17DRAFT_308867 [Neohortaea acidophila]KAF2485502.1 hypothetical protein BDY17DRAFT_308867 [Neohortaea acidophila]